MLAVAVAAATVAAAVLAAAAAVASASSGRGLIAYDTSEGIHVVRPDGGGRRLLVALRGARDPRWSPDGRRIAFSLFDREWSELDGRVVVARADGTGRRVLARGTRPEWTSDGRRLLFVAPGPKPPRRFDPPTYALRSVDVASGRTRTLISRGAPTSPIYVGGSVVFFATSTRDPDRNVLVSQRLDGTRRRELRIRWTPSREGSDGLRWAPGGRALVPCARPTRPYRPGVTESWIPDICLVRLATGSVQRLVTNYMYDTSADYSPGGAALVISSAHGVYTVARDGTRRRVLVDNGMASRVPGAPSNSTWDGDWCCTRGADPLVSAGSGPFDWADAGAWSDQ